MKPGLHNKVCFAAIIIILFMAVLYALTAGRYYINLETIWKIVKLTLLHSGIGDDLKTQALVLWSVRLPRILMTMIVGAAISVAGVVFQGLMRNPLVSPSILGISQAAGFGACLAILFLGKTALAIEFSAFLWAILAIGIVYMIGSRGVNFVTTLVLAGVIVSALFNAASSFLKYQADPYEDLPAMVFWMMGGFNNILWPNVVRTGIIAIIGITVIYLLRWRLNLFALGDEEALAMGVNVKTERKVYILFATLIVTSSAAASGVVMWIDLIVPHMARLIVGPDHDTLVPFAALMGAAFLLIVDTIIRCLPGGEMPISIITSFLGAPFFAYLLIKQNRYWE